MKSVILAMLIASPVLSFAQANVNAEELANLMLNPAVKSCFYQLEAQGKGLPEVKEVLGTASVAKGTQIGSQYKITGQFVDRDVQNGQWEITAQVINGRTAVGGRLIYTCQIQAQ